MFIIQTIKHFVMCDCKLCEELKLGENIIHKFNHCFVMFNRYPYLPGHIMVVPYEAKPLLYDYHDDTRKDIIDVIALSQKKLMDVLDIESCNTGINSGNNSGASIPNHLHIHIVPRIHNDMNFMHTTIDDKTKALKYGETYIKVMEKIKKMFD